MDVAVSEIPMLALRSLPALVALASSSGCGDAARGAVDGGEPVLSDALSMPLEPTLSLDSFSGAAACGTCHQTHYEEWRVSHHAHAMLDPVFRALVKLRQEEHDGRQDMFCLQCHSAIGTRGGDVAPGFEFKELRPITLEGVTCEACHKVAALVRPYNSGHALDPQGPMRGTIVDPAASLVHGSEYSPLHGRSEFCAGCHDIREVSGLALERPFEEWQESPAAAPPPAQMHCQHCHMPTYEGQAVAGGPVRTLHRHAWVGVGVPLAEDFVTEAAAARLRAEARALLAGAASVRIEADEAIPAGEPLDLRVVVRNEIAGHNFPTGSTFNRQVWVEVIVRDDKGRVVLEAGTLDADGELRGVEACLAGCAADGVLSLGSALVDATGRAVMLPWQATAHVSNAVPPLGEREFVLRLPQSATQSGPLQVDARVLFRAFAPGMLRALGLEALVERIEVMEVGRVDRVISAQAW